MGLIHTKKLNNVLYYPDSPVNILSETVLAEYIKDDDGTWVITKVNVLFLPGVLVGTRIQ